MARDPHAQPSTLVVTIIRYFVVLLIVATVGSWLLIGLRQTGVVAEETFAWLQWEAAAGITGGAAALWLVYAITSSLTEKRSGLRD